MRTAIPFVALWGLVSCSPASTEGLSEFRGIVKFSKGDADRLVVKYKALTGEELELKEHGFWPWWVASFKSEPAAWMLLTAYPGYNVPDVSAVEVHLFDGRWKRIAKQAFPTGYRMFLNEGTVEHPVEAGTDVLVLKTTSAGPFIVSPGPKRPAFEQGQFQRQYCGFSNGQLHLIRMLDDEGRLVRNSYRWSQPMKGPTPPARSTEEWIRSLGSSDVVESLAALAWLTGAHLSSKTPRHENVNQESLEDSRAFEAVRDHPKTAPLLKSLCEHSNPWIREVAQMGICPTDDR
jgi:hypothetical protein